MKLGLKSLLFGAHQFILHPLYVAAAWTKLYGFPRDWRLWVCFFVHDLGYYQCKDIDGEDGKLHPHLGGNIVQDWYGDDWGFWCAFHSRSLAHSLNEPISRLCVADKLAFCLENKRFYLWRCKLTGELTEYLKNARRSAITRPDRFSPAERDALLEHNASVWFDTVKRLHLEFVAAHKDLATPQPNIPLRERTVT